MTIRFATSIARHCSSRLGKIALLLALALSASLPSAQAITIETVPVGNPGNAPDPNRGFGAVDYEYQMGKYAVTISQYTAFLNAVAADDTHGLYLVPMGSYGISRLGTPGNYSYVVGDGWANRPAQNVSWGNAVRFANWLANGQPTGAQDLTTTESGSYYLNGATSHESLNAVVRSPGASWALPTVNEWVKAGYYNPSLSNYYAYATSSNDMPGTTLPDTGNNANHSALASADVGSYVNSASPYGTFDQAGGIAEWLENAIDVRRWANNNYYGQPGDPQYFMLYGHSSFAGVLPFPFAGMDGYGFRVANVVPVPEPSTLLLAVVGSAAACGFARRRRR